MKNDFLVVHKKICGENYEQVIEARRRGGGLADETR